MKERISFKYYTSDGSAKAGVQYKEVRGELVLMPGDFESSIAIPILSSKNRNPTLEFQHVISLGVGYK